MAVLPDTLDNHQRRIGIELAENLQTHLLRIDKPVPLGFVVGMRPRDDAALRLQRSLHEGLHARLLRPASLVGRRPQIAVGHELHLGRPASGWSVHATWGLT